MSSTTGNIVDDIGELQRVLSRLLAIDVAGLPAVAQMRGLQALQPAICQLQALQHRWAGVLDSGGGEAIRSEGSASTAGWLRNTLRMPGTTGLLRSASALRGLPRVAEAFAAGEISDTHVAIIARVAKSIPGDVLADGAESLLVDQARQLAPSRFGAVAQRIRDQTTPSAESPPARPPEPERWLRTNRRRDGRVAVSGMFDPEGGAALVSSLTAAMTSDVADDSQPEARRKADALLDICTRAGAGDGGSGRGQGRPDLNGIDESWVSTRDPRSTAADRPDPGQRHPTFVRKSGEKRRRRGKHHPSPNRR